MSSLYEHILGASFNDLPPALRQIHDARPFKHYVGRCAVERGTGLLARLLAVLARLPPSHDDVPVEVEITSSAQGEAWARRFGTHRMDSVLRHRGRVLEERLGAVTLRFQLAATPSGISWHLCGTRFLWLPLPAAWFSACTADEKTDGTRYLFEVRAEMRGAGLLVGYRGWMTEHEP